MTHSTKPPKPLRQRRAFVACFLFVALIGTAVGDPASDFLEGYRNFKTGERLEQSGQYEQAVDAYRECLKTLEAVQESSPEYEPVVIEFRMAKARESIARVQTLRENAPGLPAQVAGTTDAEDVGPEGPLPVFEDGPVDLPADVVIADPPAPVAPPVGRQPSASFQAPQQAPGSGGPADRGGLSFFRIPVPAEPPVTRRESMPIPRTGGGATLADRSKLSAMENEIRALRTRLQQEQLRAEELAGRLLETQARERSALHEVDRTKVAVVEAKSRLAVMQQAVADLTRSNTQLSRERESDADRIAGLEAELVAARADLEVAEEYNGELFAKLERASEFIEASEAIRVQLTDDREKLAAAVEASTDDEVKRLNEANAQLESERDEALASAERADELEETGRDLTARLADAEAKVASLEKLGPEKDRMVADLQAELVAVNTSLVELRDELASGRSQIAELEQQLTDTSAAAAAATGAIADENALLKSIVTRQLREQAKRQQARRLVEEEMEKLSVRSESLLARLEDLGAAEAELSEREERLLEMPMAGPSDGAGMTFSMVMTKALAPAEESVMDLPDGLIDRAGEANRLFAAGEHEPAAALYGELASEAPESYFVAANLGVARIRMGDFDGAIVALERALSLRPEDGEARLNLGIALYHAGRYGDARDSLRTALTEEKQNHLAHYYLGLALDKAGDEDQALDEILKAVSLKPDYAQAHLNLAVLYARKSPPAMDQARAHYEKATALGAPPDTSLEQLIQ